MDEQIEAVRRQIAEFPEKPGPRNRLAILLQSQGQLAEAEATLRETVYRFPRNPRAREELNAVLARLSAQAAPPATPPAPEPPHAEPAPASGIPRTANAPPVSRLKPQTGPDPRHAEAVQFAPIPASAPNLVVCSSAGFSDNVAISRPHPPTPLAEQRARLPIRLRSGPRAEWIAAAAVVLLVGGLWELRRHAPPGIILQKQPEIVIPRAAPGVVASPPATSLPAAPVPPAPPASLAVTPPAKPMPGSPPPAHQVVTVSPPGLPAAALPTISILYRARDGRAARAAADLADRLRTERVALTVRTVPTDRPGRPSIGYFFTEDQPAAVAISDRLAGMFGPVRRHALPRGDLRPPGYITIALP